MHLSNNLFSPRIDANNHEKNNKKFVSNSRTKKILEVS
jgi:hypothetical protein